MTATYLIGIKIRKYEHSPDDKDRQLDNGQVHQLVRGDGPPRTNQNITAENGRFGADIGMC